MLDRIKYFFYYFQAGLTVLPLGAYKNNVVWSFFRYFATWQHHSWWRFAAFDCPSSWL